MTFQRLEYGGEEQSQSFIHWKYSIFFFFFFRIPLSSLRFIQPTCTLVYLSSLDNCKACGNLYQMAVQLREKKYKSNKLLLLSNSGQGSGEGGKTISTRNIAYHLWISVIWVLSHISLIYQEVADSTSQPFFEGFPCQLHYCNLVFLNDPSF